MACYGKDASVDLWTDHHFGFLKVRRKRERERERERERQRETETERERERERNWSWLTRRIVTDKN